MLLLQSNKVIAEGFVAQAPFVARLSTAPDRPTPLRRDEIFIWRCGPLPEGYLAYCFVAEQGDECPPAGDRPTIRLPAEFHYLGHGDVVSLDTAGGRVRVLYRTSSHHNSFLVTERCNHLCLMCSQPPRDVQDDWLIDEMLQVIPLIDPSTEEIGFTGGEPTLLGERFLDVLRMAKSYLPRTVVHILSNGRRFADESYVGAYAEICHPDMMVGIPIYSDLSTIHDYVVQADGAFDETIRGILNLKRYKQKVEIRVVIHQQTYRRLPQLAEFISRNLTFVDHVALMGLEITGFTRANLSTLWIDPIDYQGELVEAVEVLDGHRINTSVYNHQLCLLDRRIWSYARRSISDWKNEYMPECTGCSVMEDCAGFFSSAAHRYSDHIRPVAADSAS